MKFFKKKTQEKRCSCAGTLDSVSMASIQEKKKQGSNIKILGNGCAKCMSLEHNVEEALQELNIHEEIEHVTDFSEIACYGVMSTTANVLDGKVLSKREIIDLLEKANFKAS